MMVMMDILLRPAPIWAILMEDGLAPKEKLIGETMEVALG